MHDPWGFPNPATAPGSAAYYSLRFAPADLRDDLAALHGWRHQVRGILEQVSDPGVAAAKLAWWREQTARTFDGTPTHPLGIRLAPVIERRGLRPEPFLAVAASVEAELAGHQPRDFAELSAHAERDLGALFELLLRVHAAADGGATPDGDQIAAVRRLGSYGGLIYQIRDSGWLLRRGRARSLFPEAQLRALALGPEELALSANRRHLPGVLGELADQTRRLRGAGDLTGLPGTIRIQVRLLDLLLGEIDSAGFDVADRRLGLTPVRKLWHAWRESRRQ